MPTDRETGSDMFRTERLPVEERHRFDNSYRFGRLGASNACGCESGFEADGGFSPARS